MYDRPDPSPTTRRLGQEATVTAPVPLAPVVMAPCTLFITASGAPHPSAVRERLPSDRGGRQPPRRRARPATVAPRLPRVSRQARWHRGKPDRGGGPRGADAPESAGCAWSVESRLCKVLKRAVLVDIFCVFPRSAPESGFSRSAPASGRAPRAETERVTWRKTRQYDVARSVRLRWRIQSFCTAGNPSWRSYSAYVTPDLRTRRTIADRNRLWSHR